MKPIKEKDVLFDVVEKFIKLLLDFCFVCSLIILKKPFSLRGQFLKIKVFPKGFFIYGELRHHKVHS